MRDAFLLILATACAAQTFLLLQAGNADRQRQSVERVSFACLDGNRLATGDKFTECVTITWRRSPDRLPMLNHAE